jgi:hypothetical protein
LTLFIARSCAKVSVSVEKPDPTKKGVIGTATLVFKLEVLPDKIVADLMPPVRRPQKHRIGLILTVANVGGGTYEGTSPDSAVLRFAVLRDAVEIWKSPEIVLFLEDIGLTSADLAVQIREDPLRTREALR